MEKNNPPAFPADQSGDGYHSGMTLRDYFAGQALAGMLSSYEGGLFNARVAARGIESLPTFNAGLSYEYADAMLAARKEQS